MANFTQKELKHFFYPDSGEKNETKTACYLTATKTEECQRKGKYWTIERLIKLVRVCVCYKLYLHNLQLSDVHIQERVMDELKTLHLYMRGKGFRKNTNDYEDA